MAPAKTEWKFWHMVSVLTWEEERPPIAHMERLYLKAHRDRFARLYERIWKLQILVVGLSLLSLTYFVWALVERFK